MLVWSHTGFLQTGIYSSKLCHSIIHLSFSPVSIYISVLICSYFTYLLAIDPFGKYVYMKNVGKLSWRSQGQNMSGNMNNSLYLTDVYMSL